MITARHEKVVFSHAVQMAYQIWHRNFLQFQRSIWISVLWIVIEPLFILAAMGFGLGSFVPHMQGVAYADFFYPGLICSASMFVSFFVSTYDNFSKLTHQQFFQTVILSPIEPRELIWGELIWAASKGTFSAIGVSLVASLFGLVETWRIIPAIGIVFLSSLVFAALGLLVVTMVRNYDQIIYPTSGLIMPMSLFSGTYFPVDHLPMGISYLTYLFPLTHAVRVVRMLLLQGWDWWMLANVAYLLLALGVLVHFSTKRLTQKLLD